ncbi:MAG: DUF362 domain-containing protein [Oscillospiraceae bacterium]|nr:DUF362 domain-containing protein [Oscillospiraceae bacterium]
MEKSKVYFSDMRALPGTNLQEKLEKLIRAAGIGNIDFSGKFTAIKIHFGEPGNLAFLRPNWAKTVADTIKSLGGKPFLTDCNTLYVGRRKNALEHLEAAYENGYSPFSTGCHIIIADGLKGTDETIVPINGEYVQEAKIGTAIMDADIFISLNHFKGHEATGFGGAIKNIGMGCGSRAGKMEQHYSGKPLVDKELCRGCKICTRNCAHDAISFDENRKASIDHGKCVGCGRCIGACPFDAIGPSDDSAEDHLNRKMAEYALAVVKDRPHFHISLVIDVSPYCDCHAENDVAIIPDVGMFASFDPVALDQACADACNRQDAMIGSMLDEKIKECGCGHSHDHFHTVSPNTNWKVCLEHAEKIGLGQREYELIEVK